MGPDTGAGGGGLALLSVPGVEALAALDDDGLVEAMVSYERAVAVLAGLSSVAAGLVAQRRHEQALVEAGPGASAGTVQRVTQEAEAAVVDEIRLACGLGLSDVVARVRLGRASAARAGCVRGRLAEGCCLWAMARAWQEATTDLPAEVADAIAAVALGPTRDGAALSMALFRQRLGRQIAKHRTARQRRDFDLSRRDAFATVTPHGSGEITVSGSAERVTAAIERVAGIARALRRMGDDRTLAQLRSDVLLDLVIFGDIPAGVPLAAAATAAPGTTAASGASAAPVNAAAATPTPAGAAPTTSPDPGVDRRTNAPADGQEPAPRPNPSSWPTRPDSPESSEWTESPGGPERVGWPDPPTWTKPPERPERVGWPASPAWSEPSVSSEPPASPQWPQWVGAFAGGLPPALIQVTIPLTALMDLPGHNPEPGRLPAGDYLPAHLVRELAYAAGTTWLRLVTDPLTGEAIDLTSSRYRPPPRLAAAVRLRDGTCRAPAALTPADRCDLDHDTPWHRGGATCAANLSAKARRPHQHKTSGQWATRQDPDGSITWTTGTGRTYTTYPMQYDPTAPGRPEVINGTAREADWDAHHPGYLDPERDNLADLIDHAELSAAVDIAVDRTDRAEAIDDTEFEPEDQQASKVADGADPVESLVGAEIADTASIDAAGRAGAAPADSALSPHGEEWHPIDYRDKGTTPTTRPAKRPLGTRRPRPTPPYDQPPRPDPGPPPF